MAISKHALTVFLAASILGFLLPGTSLRGDVIRLNNGQSMEGIILQEREREIVLGLGVGEVTLKRSRIAAIEKSSASEQRELQQSWKSQYVIHENYAPAGFDDLIKGLAELDRRKKEAVQSHRNIKKTIADNAVIQRKAALEQRAYIEVSARLKQADPHADLQTYNRLVKESNQLSSALVVKRGLLGRQEQNLRTAEKRIAAYQESLTAFNAEYEMRKGNYQGKHSPDKDREFFDTFDKRLAQHRDTVQDAIVPHAQYGEHMVVAVRINDRVTAQLMVDTGASLVVLPRNLLPQLGALAAGKPINLTMADGSVSQGTPVILDEVVVGDARARHVEAVLIDQKSDQPFDGLLGMSFLKNFTVSYNPVRDELLLRSFKAD